MSDSTTLKPASATAELAELVASQSIVALADVTARLKLGPVVLADANRLEDLRQALVRAIGEDYPNLLEQLRLIVQQFYLGDEVARLLLEVSCRGYAVRALQIAGYLQ